MFEALHFKLNPSKICFVRWSIFLLNTGKTEFILFRVSYYVLCPQVTLDKEAGGPNQILFVQRGEKRVGVGERGRKAEAKRKQ